MYRAVLIVSAFSFLVGCAGFGDTITNYDQRSVVYGWINIDDVSGNHLMSVTMKQYKPRTDKPFYHMAIEEMDGGYLFYHHGFVNGSFKAESASAQTCLLFLCGNTINEYNFGRQGNDGAVIINNPGVYFVGSYEMLEEDTGFFEQAKFRVRATDTMPSKAEMLNVILKDSPKDYPIVTQRIQAAM